MPRAALKADPAVLAEAYKPSPLLEEIWAAREVADAGSRLLGMRNDPESRVIREACQMVLDRARAKLRKVQGHA